MLAVLSLLAVAAVGVLTMGPDGVTGEVTADDLDAPPEPPRAYVADTEPTVPVDTHPLATGWEVIELTGGGVTSDVAHGGAGWLAVTEAGGFVAHTSPNGVLWQARTIPELSGFGVRAAVGDDVMAVVTSGGGSPWQDWPSTAVSQDGGAGWSVVPLDERGAMVDDVRAVSGTVYVFGGLGSSDLPPPTPAVWWWDGSGWVAAVATGPGAGLVTEVIETPDGTTLALGLTDGDPAAWEVSSEGLIPFDADLGGALITEALPVPGGGFLALGISDERGRPVDRFLRSEDGRSWFLHSEVDPLAGLTVTGPDRFVAIGLDESFLQAYGPDGSAEITVGDRPTRSHLAAISAIAASNELMVMGGLGPDGEAALAVRGLTTAPVSLPAPTAARWQVVAGADTRWLDRPLPTGVAGGCGDPLVQVGSTVWRLRATDGLPSLEEASRSAIPFVGCSPGGPWLVSGDELRILDGASWRRIDAVPVSTVAAVGLVDGTELMLGYGGLGVLEAYRLDDGRPWEPLTTPQEVRNVIALDNGFVGQRLVGSAPTTVVTEDGVTWTPIEGLLSGSVSLPYVTVPGERGRVRVLDRWPDVEELSLPTPSVSVVMRHGDGFIAQSPGSVWISMDDGTWERLPAGIENGVGAFASLVPGDPPLLAVHDGASVQLLAPP
jgi:hypothetical protein